MVFISAPKVASSPILNLMSSFFYHPRGAKQYNHENRKREEKTEKTKQTKKKEKETVKTSTTNPPHLLPNKDNQPYSPQASYPKTLPNTNLQPLILATRRFIHHNPTPRIHLINRDTLLRFAGSATQTPSASARVSCESYSGSMQFHFVSA